MRLPVRNVVTQHAADLPCRASLALSSLGLIDQSTLVKAVKELTEEDRRRQALLDARPPLDTVLNMHDFETVARKVLPEKAWVRVLASCTGWRVARVGEAHDGVPGVLLVRVGRRDHPPREPDGISTVRHPLPSRKTITDGRGAGFGSVPASFVMSPRSTGPRRSSDRSPVFHSTSYVCLAPHRQDSL